MKKEIDIHDYPRKLEHALRNLRGAPISEINRRHILEFRDFCSTDGMSLARTERYIGVLVGWAQILGMDFEKATKEDIMRAVRQIQETERYSPWTKATYKIMLKRFFRWLKKTGADRRRAFF